MVIAALMAATGSARADLCFPGPCNTVPEPGVLLLVLVALAAAGTVTWFASRRHLKKAK